MTKKAMSEKLIQKYKFKLEVENYDKISSEYPYIKFEKITAP